MTRIRALFATLALAVGALAFGVGMPAADATSICATGDGCLHTDASSNSAVTWHRAAYATYAIYGWNGTHWVENAQTGGAFMELLDKNKHVVVTLEDGQNGRPARAQDVNMGPIYYVRLSPGPSCWPRCS